MKKFTSNEAIDIFDDMNISCDQLKPNESGEFVIKFAREEIHTGVFLWSDGSLRDEEEQI